MKQTEYLEKLHLMVFEELEPAERKALEDHLLTCGECRDELARIRKLHSLLLEFGPSVRVDETLLQEARQQFREAWRRERSRPHFLENLEERLSVFIPPRYQVALGGLATLALGILIGVKAFVPAALEIPPADGQVIPADARITNVSFLEAGEAPDVVEFTFDAVRAVRMKGSVNDPRIQKVLTHAMLNDVNPGVRLRAVNAVSTPRAELPDREIKTALILTLRTDPNAGVRKEALIALQRYPPDDEVKNALLNSLMTDKNPGIRIAAINGLDSIRTRGRLTDQSIRNVLKDRMQTDENSYIRLRARTVLQEAREQ